MNLNQYRNSILHMISLLQMDDSQLSPGQVGIRGSLLANLQLAVDDFNDLIDAMESYEPDEN